MLALRLRSTRAAALAAAVVTATPLLAGTAGAATASPAVGSAGATITVLKVDSAAASIRALTASLSASTAANPDAATITVTPAWSSATGAVGTVVVTPADSPKHVGAGTLALPSGLASLAGPAVDVVASAANGSAFAGVTGKALGTITVLGTPLNLGTGALDLSSRVTKTASASSKSITLQQLALPTILDLLSGLGLDLSTLTQTQLTALFNVVSASVGATVTSAVGALNTQVDAAQTAASTSADTVAEAAALVASDQNTVDTATADVTTALAPINAVISGGLNAVLNAAGVTSPLDAQSWALLSLAQRTAIDTVIGGTTTAVDTAVAALTAANAALNAAQALLADLLALIDSISSALDSDPLASLGGISAGTSAVAGTVGTASGHLTVGTVNVLGANVLPAQLTTALSTVTTALSSALNNIAGVTFTPPSIAIGAITKHTSQAAKTATADVTVAGLKVTLPTLQLPQSLALPNAGSLPGLDLVNGVLSSVAGTVTVAELTDSASFTQAGAPTSGDSGGGSLPTTGAPAGLALGALVAIGLGITLRRRTRTNME